ncbi:Ferripyoverdine receptor [Pandoraea capi]|uniref:Ferripyoverdine receptor n=1 Tax=Pandoraea capi TaxID=2508286 RepID=A0ABY6VWN2_9BURK|nr:hypothetical protein [Pandoraea capi]VVD97848.1 Ferripyoverdine receptor [Pandoraea capi]
MSPPIALDISTPLTPSGNIRTRIVAVGQDARSFLDHDKLRRQSLYGVIDAVLTRDTTVSLGYQFSHASPKGMPWGGQPMHGDAELQDVTGPAPTDATGGLSAPGYLNSMPHAPVRPPPVRSGA